MTLSDLPSRVLLATGTALVVLGVRDGMTGSLVGAVLAGTLGIAFLAGPWVLDSRRRPGP